MNKKLLNFIVVGMIALSIYAIFISDISLINNIGHFVLASYTGFGLRAILIDIEGMDNI